MCIYKNENSKANLYLQPCNLPTTRDVYLKYNNEHYDSICSQKNSVCTDQLSFNLTQYDIDAFAKIGAFFHITDPVDPINGGKLYLVPPPNFADSECASISEGSVESKTFGQREQLNAINQTLEEIIFVPGEEILENGVRDFNLETMGGEEQEEEEAQAAGNKEEEEQEVEVYDMFAQLDLSEKVPEQFQFEEDNSGNEDAVLGNSDDELENVTPLKPPQKRSSNSNFHHKQPKAKKDLKLNKPDFSIDLTQTDQQTRSDEPRPNEPMVLIDLTSKFEENGVDDSEPTSDPNSNVNSDAASFLSDSLSSTSWQKLRKWEKVKLDVGRMAHAPVKIVDEIPWGITGDGIYRVKCTEKNWLGKYEDGRWFHLRNSTRQGL